MRKLISILAASALLSVAAAGTSFAEKIAVLAPVNSDNVVWVPAAALGSASGTLTVGADAGATLVSSLGVTPDGSATLAQFSSSGSSFSGVTETLNGSSFDITDGSTTLLSGTYGAATLVTSGNGVSINATDVNYTGGTFLDGDTFTNGTFTIEGDDANGGAGATVTPGKGFEYFTASDGITFSGDQVVTSTPEPASFATFGIGAAVLMMLGFAAKRRSSVSAL